MNHENRPPNGPEGEFEALEFDRHLAEVEQRLRHARPRPPQLDAAAIMRLLDEPNVAQPPPAVETHVAQPPSAVKNRPTTTTPTTTEPPTIQGQPRAAIPHVYRRLATVAGSSTCGAVVGAVVMFLAVDRSGPAIAVPSDEAVRTEQQTLSTDRETLVADREAKPRPPEATSQRIAREWNADILRRIVEPSRWGISDEPVFRAGMHLVQNNVSRRRDTRPYCETSRFGDDAMSEDAWRLPVEPPMTRERLLEELSRQTPGHVL